MTDEVVDLSQRTDDEIKALTLLRYPDGITWGDADLVQCPIVREIVFREMLKDRISKPYVNSMSVEGKINAIETQLNTITTIIKQIQDAGRPYGTGISYSPPFNYNIKPDGSTY